LLHTGGLLPPSYYSICIQAGEHIQHVSPHYPPFLQWVYIFISFISIFLSNTHYYCMQVNHHATTSPFCLYMSITNFIWTITLGILNWFWQYKWPLKALKKTFQMVPKTSQGDQYSLSYQQISLQSPSHQTLNSWYLRNCLT